jgi:hypothetical protein
MRYNVGIYQMSCDLQSLVKEVLRVPKHQEVDLPHAERRCTSSGADRHTRLVSDE